MEFEDETTIPAPGDRVQSIEINQTETAIPTPLANLPVSEKNKSDSMLLLKKSNVEESDYNSFANQVQKVKTINLDLELKSEIQIKLERNSSIGMSKVYISYLF